MSVNFKTLIWMSNLPLRLKYSLFVTLTNYERWVKSILIIQVLDFHIVKASSTAGS